MRNLTVAVPGCRRGIVLGVVITISLLEPRATIAADLPPLKDDAPWPLITPYNYDRSDPAEYTRRGGTTALGCVSSGRVWNRALPRRLPRTTTTQVESRLIEPADAPEAPIEPLVVPDAPAPIVIAAATGAAPEPSRRAASLVLGHETRQLGKSVLGLPIVGHFFGQTGPKTLIFAAIHGDEPSTAFIANQLVEHLIKNPEAYFGRRVAVVPVANPDGLARGTRTNARDVDLNRNFPARNFAVQKRGRYFGGEEPASEPETQALIELLDQWQPQRIITIHAIRRGRHGNNYDGPAEAIAKLMSVHNGYAVLSTIGYPTPGSFGSWAGIDRQIPTITLEVPSDASGANAWRENREALLSVIHAR